MPSLSVTSRPYALRSLQSNPVFSNLGYLDPYIDLSGTMTTPAATGNQASRLQATPLTEPAMLRNENIWPPASLPTRKRVFDETGISPQSRKQKSRMALPSPAASAFPTSSPSRLHGLDDDIIDLTG